MKIMVSGRNSYRNRKIMFFGKIPQKNSMIEKKFGHRKIFDDRKNFDQHLEKFCSPKKYFFDRKNFRCRKNLDRFFCQSFFFVQKQVLDNFFTSFLLTKSLLPPTPHTHIHSIPALRGWPHGGHMTEKKCSSGQGMSSMTKKYLAHAHQTLRIVRLALGLGPYRILRSGRGCTHPN